MKLIPHRRTVLVAVVASLFALAGCGEDSTTAPTDDASDFVSDPFGDLSGSGNSLSNPGAIVDRLVRILGLDEAQAEALAAAYATFQEGIEAVRAQLQAGTITIEEARARAHALREAFEAELKLILTAEQYDRLQELRDRHQGPRDHAARWAEWLKKIGADEDQTAAVFDALHVLRKGVREVRQQVRRGELTREEARGAVASLVGEFDAELRRILTPEQYAALEELRPDRDGRHH